VIYLDASVALANVFVEDRTPPARLWNERLISSRLLQYEVWTRIHARSANATHGDAARAVLNQVALIELAPPVLERALNPFPRPVRTLDALHLATIEFIRAQGQSVELATYDEQMLDGARALRIPLFKV